LAAGRVCATRRGGAAVFRPQIVNYNSIEEEAAALMESLGQQPRLHRREQADRFYGTDVFLRINGFELEADSDLDTRSFMVDGPAGIPLCQSSTDPAAHQV